MAEQTLHVFASMQKPKSLAKSDVLSVVSNADFGIADAIASNALLGPKGLCVIIHNAEQYILRRTRNNKLILTK